MAPGLERLSTTAHHSKEANHHTCHLLQEAFLTLALSKPGPHSLEALINSERQATGPERDSPQPRGPGLDEARAPDQQQLLQPGLEQST